MSVLLTGQILNWINFWTLSSPVAARVTTRPGEDHRLDSHIQCVTFLFHLALALSLSLSPVKSFLGFASLPFAKIKKKQSKWLSPWRTLLNAPDSKRPMAPFTSGNAKRERERERERERQRVEKWKTKQHKHTKSNWLNLFFLPCRWVCACFNYSFDRRVHQQQKHLRKRKRRRNWRRRRRRRRKEKKRNVSPRRHSICKWSTLLEALINCN